MLVVADYTNESHPSAVYQALLDGGVFALPRCRNCDRSHYPPRVLCPQCGSTSLTWQRSTGCGVVYSASTLRPKGEEPYSVILVDLDDGPRMMSNLVGVSPDEVQIGARVSVELSERDGTTIPLFVVAADERTLNGDAGVSDGR